MFSRFRPSCLKLNNIINIRKYTTDRVKGSPFHAENVILYKYKPNKWETLPFHFMSGVILVYIATFSSTYLTFLNKAIVVEEETAEELQQRMDDLQKLEEAYANKKINHPSYFLRNSIYTHKEAYRKGVNDIFCLAIAAIGCAAAYAINKVPKKIVVEVAKLDNRLIMKTYNNKNIIELPHNTFKVGSQNNVALKKHETCLFFAYGTEENKRKRQDKILNLKDLYMLKIEGADYPNDWSTFQFYINKK